MSATELIEQLHGRGIRLWEEQGALRFRGPRGALTEDLRAALRERRAEVLAALAAGPAPIEHDAAGRYDPFPLTDVQSAYLIGRLDAVGHDGVACHVYLEKTYADRDPERLADAWRRIVAHHDMLRVVFTEDGSQRVLETGPDPTPRVLDLRGRAPDEVEAARDEVRDGLAESVHDPSSGRMHELCLTRADDGAVLHVSIDFLVADWSSISRVLGELDVLHDDPSARPAPAAIGFRDYVLAEQRELDSPAHQEDRRYWWDRIDDLPGAPELPRAPRATTTPGPAFRRHRLRLDRARWQALSGRARARGVTPSTAVLAAYASVMGRWSRRRSFCLNLTLLGRRPRHPDVPALVGDFTSVSLLQVDDAAPRDLATLARAVGARLFDDLDHRSFSGLRVMRELARRRGREAALMPVVFTSAIGLDAGAGTGAGGDTDRHGISQTPQVVVDCQVVDDADGLSANWDVRSGVLPDGVAEDMVAAFLTLLEALADSDDAWDSPHDAPLPEDQRRARDRVNAATSTAPQGLLQDGFLRWSAARPRHPAVVGPGATLDYGELEAWARHTAAALVAAGVSPGERVAVVMSKGPEQVVAVLAVLLAGATYVPVDTSGPRERRSATLDAADVRAVVTQPWPADLADPADLGVAVVVVDLSAPPGSGAADTTVATAAHGSPASPDDVAYVIYTSGSTGRPKGVMVTHRAARTTIDDVLVRFGIGAQDRALGLAALGFDLSVHDVFGTLAAGGTLVLPDPDRGADPSHWGDLVAAHDITVWNSVPAQMTMLVTMLESTGRRLDSLRAVLLSGDWIPPTLPDRIRAACPAAAPVSLGGATEAAIWSIHHHIGAPDPDWPSVPYGVPLDRQGFRVLDAADRDRPDWVAGELVIVGDGLAVGYHGDPALTAERFVRHRDGTRMYRTGDVGRYRPGGILEFLGREDTQVKIRGHRIELGEVEAALTTAPGVGEAVAVLDRDPGPDADPRLVAAVVPASGRQPVDLDAVDDHLRGRLPAAAIPAQLLVLDALPVTGNGKIDRARLRRVAEEQAPEPGTGPTDEAGQAPVDDVERELARHAAVLLSVPSVGRAVSLYDLGADSLVMARLVGRWREQVEPAGTVPFDVLLRRLLNTPTIAAVAELVRPQAAARATGSTASPATTAVPRGDGLAELVWFSPQPTGPAEPVRVLFHAGFGTMDCFTTLAARLVAQERGPTVGIALGDADAYCALPSAQVVPRAADDHTRSLLASGARRFQLVGYCIGGLFAAEVASRLVEHGAEVTDLTLVDAMPMPFVVDDELFVENAFVPSLGLDPIRSVWGGVEPADLWRAVDRVTTEHGGRLPDGALAAVDGDPGLEAVAAAVARARERTQTARLAGYAAEAAGGTPHSPEAIPALFRTFRQSLRASGHRVEPWDGDAAFLRPAASESASGTIGELTTGYWRDVVLGELSVVDVGGDHLSCVEDPHVAAVADVLAARLG